MNPVSSPDVHASRPAPVREVGNPADGGGCGCHAEPDRPALSVADAARIALAGAGAFAAWRGWLPSWRGVDVVPLAVLAVAGWPVFREALENLRARRMTMELSMTVAFAAAAAARESVALLVMLASVLCAEVLERLTVGRGRRAIQRILDLLPRTAVVRRGGSETTRDVAEVVPGDIVVVPPGAQIPVDGTVTAGASAVDESVVTGESLPAEKSPGAAVFAGSQNRSGSLEIRAERVGEDTAFGRILDAVEHAERTRAPVQGIADRLAAGLVAAALLAAAATWLLTRDPRAAIAAVIVAGACGVAVGTPLAILGAIGRAARFGVVFKGGRFLEELSRVDTVIFDKTGTATYGRPDVVAVLPADGVPESELLEAAATAELRSEHPLAEAIVRAAAARGVTPRAVDSVTAFPGTGVEARSGSSTFLAGNPALFAARSIPATLPADDGLATTVAVARDGRFLGSLRLADRLRPEASAVVAELARRGLRTELLSGDSPRVVESVGKTLGVDRASGGATPEAKIARVAALVAEGRRVAMIGDGINDAPALAKAHVGVAMGSGTSLTRESADVVLIGSDLRRFVHALSLSRRCLRIVRFNFWGTVVIDLAGIGLAATGFLSPVAATLVHVGSEILFILNASRMIPRGGKAAA